MLADIIDVFGKRFDKIGERFDKLDLRVDGVKSKVDGIERRLDTEAMARQDQKLPDRVARIEKHLGLDKTITA
jgi:hypothetical protein